MTMTDQTESASEYAELLSIHDRVGKWGTAFDSEPMQTAEATASAIRALEARVREGNDAIFKAGQMFGDTTLSMSREIDAIRADRDRLAGEVEKLAGLYNQRMIHLNAAQDREVALLDEVERIRVQFDEAIARIEDMLEEDDGQAFKEAGKFLLRIKGHDHES